MARDWWEDFFDAEYARLWAGAEAPDKTEGQVAGLWELLTLAPGVRVLDAPCGYGRISRGLAARGADVLGVDQSADLLAQAERERGEVPAARLRYLRQDLRAPLAEGGFDVALNVFSSLGYGSDDDDLAILRTLRAALRPGGRLFIETNHRDRVAANLDRNTSFAQRLPDGTLFMEEPRLDPIAGRVHMTFYWAGPRGAGQKTGSIRVYTPTELVRLLQAAGLRFVSAHDGCSPAPFAPQGGVGARLGLLAVRD